MTNAERDFPHQTSAATDLTQRLWLDEHDPLIKEAIRIWEERERGFPKFTQRMRPDVMDSITGAWQRCLAEAERNLNRT